MTGRASVAVVHPDLSARGGAEAVCLHALEALQDRYDVTLYTLAPVDLAALNDYHGTDAAVPVARVGGAVRRLRDALVALADTDYLGLLDMALLSRLAPRIAADHDVVVGTKNELAVGPPSVQYLHFPAFDRSVVPRRDAEAAGTVSAAYDRVCDLLAGFDPAVLQRPGTVPLTNSEWMRDRIGETYGVEPAVVYPPVAVDAFDGAAWAERDHGFVSVGRLTPDKNVHRTVDIVAGVRDRGHDVHLHLVGPVPDTDYGDGLRERAAGLSFVSVEGAVPRERLVELVCTHRWGIHGKDREHFGMAVAELVAGGTVPFVPDDGGQRAIVGDDRLRYRDAEDAVAAIDGVLSDPATCEALRDHLAGRAAEFGPERFAERLRAAVDRALTAADGADG
ncbi:glycosyltransferase family 4 protein [Halosimplex halophilum]|uniref:glycosyltransferase family 4 protein n=1 Tax=Halosimplex halophilum TaxID=2559572 RepID=UPI00107EEF9A|nr:glycosyltransferase family 4 protein [Halosimplex halophilum]